MWHTGHAANERVDVSLRCRAPFMTAKAEIAPPGGNDRRVSAFIHKLYPRFTNHSPFTGKSGEPNSWVHYSELLGLRWQDVDLEHATCYVRMSVQEAERGFVLAETKTAYSRRSIKLSKLSIAALRRHKARQEEEERGAL